MVFDLTNRYSSPGCLLFFLNVPHNIFRIEYTVHRAAEKSPIHDHRSSPVPELHDHLSLDRVVHPHRSFNYLCHDFDRSTNGYTLSVRRKHADCYAPGIPKLHPHVYKSTDTRRTEYFFSPPRQHGAAYRFLHLFNCLLQLRYSLNQPSFSPLLFLNDALFSASEPGSLRFRHLLPSTILSLLRRVTPLLPPRPSSLHSVTAPTY